MVARLSIGSRMPVVIVRHAERVDYCARGDGRGKEWISSTERPWDTPITRKGVLQARAMGRAVKRHLGRLQLPGVSRVFCSPLLRCMQTATAAALELGKSGVEGAPPVVIEATLVEALCQSWYLSWCCDGSDSTWGGTPEMKENEESVTPDASRASGKRAHEASNLLVMSGCAEHISNTNVLLHKEMNQLVQFPYAKDGAGGLTSFRGGDFRWDEFESKAMLQERCSVLLER